MGMPTWIVQLHGTVVVLDVQNKGKKDGFQSVGGLIFKFLDIKILGNYVYMCMCMYMYEAYL